MGLSYGLVNLMYSMLCSEHWRIKGSRSNKRRKLLTCFANSLFKVCNNLSCRETEPKAYNNYLAVSTRWRFLPYDLITIQNLNKKLNTSLFNPIHVHCTILHSCAVRHELAEIRNQNSVTMNE